MRKFRPRNLNSTAIIRNVPPKRVGNTLVHVRISDEGIFLRKQGEAYMPLMDWPMLLELAERCAGKTASVPGRLGDAR